MTTEATTQPGPAPTAKEPDPPMTPAWTQPEDITPELRAYYWELERQLGRRQHQLEVILDSDDYHDRPVDPVRAETIRLLRREIELLDKAWGYPPFTIKDWDSLPESLVTSQEEEEEEEEEKETPDPGVGERRRLFVLKLIRDLGLDPLAIRQPAGTTGDKAAVRALYMAGHRARRQAHIAANKAFDNAWDRLRKEGKIKDADPPKF